MGHKAILDDLDETVGNHTHENLFDDHATRKADYEKNDESLDALFMP